MVDLNQESVIFTLFMCVFLAFLSKSPYLCNVFFIVLDLRLTKVGTWRSPFFCAHT